MPPKPSTKKKSAPRKAAARHADPVRDAIAAAAAFAKPILEHLRDVVAEAVPHATVAWKWGRPFFLVDGEILCNMVAFKEHCSFGFWSPEMNALLAADGILGGNGGGSFGKIRSLDDLPSRRKLVAYVRKAEELRRTGAATSPVVARSKRPARPTLPVPDDLAKALGKAKAAAQNFEAFSPSEKREYITWITGAKREETRVRRVASAVERIRAGKAMNEEYRSR
jgi:hypothetical protein